MPSEEGVWGGAGAQDNRNVGKRMWKERGPVILRPTLQSAVIGLWARGYVPGPEEFCNLLRELRSDSERLGIKIRLAV